MNIGEMDGFITNTRAAFQLMLTNGTDNMENMKEFLRNQLDSCCSEFEEQTLTENLKEEFSQYLDDLREKESA